MALVVAGSKFVPGANRSTRFLLLRWSLLLLLEFELFFVTMLAVEDIAVSTVESESDSQSVAEQSQSQSVS